LFDGKEQIALFPWMKEIHLNEGHDVYSLMPEGYASADKWILRYLQSDKEIVKHIGPDNNDTAYVLFKSFIETELRKQGLNLSDVGMQRQILKKQFCSWADCPKPSSLSGSYQAINCPSSKQDLIATAAVDINSHENPGKKLNTLELNLSTLDYGSIPIYFEPIGDADHLLHTTSDNTLRLDPSDKHIDVKVTYSTPFENRFLSQSKTFTLTKGTTASLCFSCPAEGSELTSQFYDDFSKKTEDHTKINSLLALVGMSYFEKCDRAEKSLALIHKVMPKTICAFGLAKLSPDTLKDGSEVRLPQLDMIRINANWLHTIDPMSLTALRQYHTMHTVDQSSNEHQTLREIFNDPFAISTVKLLQLAYATHKKNGYQDDGFMAITSSNLAIIEQVKQQSPIQWQATTDVLTADGDISSWAYAYMTPGLISSLDGTHSEIGALILHPHLQYSLLSSKSLVLNGGIGSPLSTDYCSGSWSPSTENTTNFELSAPTLFPTPTWTTPSWATSDSIPISNIGSSVPSEYFTSSSIKDWQMTPIHTDHIRSVELQIPSLFPLPHLLSLSDTKTTSAIDTSTWRDDVRSFYKTVINQVADPVDVVTGAFYIDETDLIFSGPISHAIRRNYNSQNPLLTEMGYGWKININPFLVDQNGKLFAAELDGTIIVYSYNPDSSRWEPNAEDNPELTNLTKLGIGAVSPFHSYIKDNVLYGADGSQRFFEGGILKKWTNAQGRYLLFFYDNKKLSKIESCTGDSCNISYIPEGKIKGIYAKDGRHVTYQYNAQGDLVRVTLPSGADIVYEYDRSHRIIRETKPYGNVIENIYDDHGRVVEQRSPVGANQTMIRAATFTYSDGETTVTDGEGGSTQYKIYNKQIYKVTDPFGATTLQAWFLDSSSWFDPETEQILPYHGEGSFKRSLKWTRDKRGLKTSYLYDKKGNPTSITIEGDDLTGSLEKVVSKKISYNDNNLPVAEEIFHHKTVTCYDTTFRYLPKNIQSYSDGTLISYSNFEYNRLGQLIKQDISGSITLWQYHDSDLPSMKTDLTGTQDPDVITTYQYNQQGQCIKVLSEDGMQQMAYDIMGNLIEHKRFSKQGDLLSAEYNEYNLNNALVCQRKGSPYDTVYFDYNNASLIKAKRQLISQVMPVAYTLYEYSPCGYLIEEIDPRGHLTSRSYDLMGRVSSESKEGHTTHFSYEPGGLLASRASPSGATVNYTYTTNGLLTTTTYPDGTSSKVIYDLLGRVILETKDSITWRTEYDGNTITKTHVASNTKEVSELDTRGNLIRFTDPAGYTTIRTYDGLSRITSETTPKGQKTLWQYQDDLIICYLPCGEVKTTQYALGQAIRSDITDSNGTLISSLLVYFDPSNSKEETIQGNIKTTTWRNGLGLPTKIETGLVTTAYEYDLCGNCICSIDGDGLKKVSVKRFQETQKAIKEHLKTAKISLHYLPPYSPNLKPIERLWKWMKERVLYNTYYECFEDFRRAILGFFAILDTVAAESILGQDLRTRVRDTFSPIQAPKANF
ncbi:MAG: hypothetical protein FJZ57_02250, partial [Chlamydiae bacterium]|nr:hypothetical protein [Chlamydiota bacterium]